MVVQRLLIRWLAIHVIQRALPSLYLKYLTWAHPLKPTVSVDGVVSSGCRETLHTNHSKSNNASTGNVDTLSLSLFLDRYNNGPRLPQQCSFEFRQLAMLIGTENIPLAQSEHTPVSPATDSENCTGQRTTAHGINLHIPKG
jgi:hypothetical protein